MRKFIISLVVLIAVLLVSGYIENSYCHYWTTTPPFGSETDYIKTTGFCGFNSYISLPGALFLSLIKF